MWHHENMHFEHIHRCIAEKRSDKSIAIVTVVMVNGNGKCQFVERINARNLSTATTPLMRYVSQLRRKHTSLYAVLKLSIFKTMNACNGVVEWPADYSWPIAGNV